MAPCFGDLSDDIINVILDHVVPLSDLVSLLRTSKRVHELCLRRLYRLAAVTVGGGYDEVYIPMLNAGNKGLAHIRILDMGIDQDNVNDGTYRQSQFILGMFLEVIPPNTLEEFIWRSWDPLTAENTKRLYRTQKKLKYLEAGGVDPHFTDKMVSDWQLDSIFDQVDELGFFLESKGALQLSHEMLIRLKKPLKKLILTSHMSGSDAPISMDEFCDSSTRPGTLASTVFSHMMPFAKCNPIKLEELTFNDIYLRHPRDTFCRIFNFADITRLVLEKCKGAEVLLAELCRSSLLPTNLKTFNFLHTEQTMDDEALKALEDFLSLLTGLKELAVDISYASRLPSVGKITPHARTLKVLSLHAYDSDNLTAGEEEHHYSNEDFASMCKNCTELEELSIAAPGVEVFESSNEHYDRFKDSIMGADSKLDVLHTLQITTWPSSDALTETMPRGLYDALLKVKAMEFFKAREVTGKLPRLHLIEWGSEGCFHRRCIVSGVSSTIFVRNTENTPDGKQRQTCISVVPDWRTSKLSLPTEVLAVTLAKHRVPPALSRGKEDSDSGNVPVGWKPPRMPDNIVV